METKEMKAVISKKFSKSAWILLVCWVGIFALLTALCFALGKQKHYSPLSGNTYYELCWLGIQYGKIDSELYIDWDGFFILIVILNILIFTIVPLIYLLINRRKRKLTELTANDMEIVGSYTGFIPISKITLKMPIEKIDNIAAVKNFFFLYTGKALRIASTSGVIRIPYVLNADEVVAFLSEAIEKAKNSPVKAVAEQEKPQGDAADSLKKLAELRNAGIITEEEFNQKKNELLGKM